MRWLWSRIFIRPRVEFRSLLLQTNTVCQNRCKECITAEAMVDYPGYQLTIEQVKQFIRTLEESRYWVEELHLNGLGEPTLWKHFNEGCQLLHKCKNIGRISFVTNGKTIHLVDKKTLDCFHLIYLSSYPAKELEAINAAVYATGVPVSSLSRVTFGVLPRRRYPGTIPAICFCLGPTYIDGKILLHCGSAAFHAYKVAGWNPPLVPCVKGWGDNFKKEFQGNMPICEYCPANTTVFEQCEKFTYENKAVTP